eukprot:9229131-Pyramimonas_sp.AAC.1
MPNWGRRSPHITTCDIQLGYEVIDLALNSNNQIDSFSTRGLLSIYEVAEYPNSVCTRHMSGKRRETMLCLTTLYKCVGRSPVYYFVELNKKNAVLDEAVTRFWTTTNDAIGANYPYVPN